MKRKNWFRASCLGKSIQENIDAYYGKKPKRTRQERLMLDVGTAIHRVYFGKKENQKEYYNEELWLRGTPDCIEKKVIQELKTMNGIQFSKLKEPLPEHIIQLHAYFILTGLQYGKIIYLDRNFFNEKVFKVRLDPQVIQEVLEKIELLKKEVEKR